LRKRVKSVKGSGNVFRDLGFPEGEACNLALRSQLRIYIERFVTESGLTQVRAAEQLGLTQPRLNALMRGKLELFSLDSLVNTATRAGLNVELRITTARRKGSRSVARTRTIA
jgi:predicted XRE-type DNA-binding protein